MRIKQIQLCTQGEEGSFCIYSELLLHSGGRRTLVSVRVPEANESGIPIRFWLLPIRTVYLAREGPASYATKSTSSRKPADGDTPTFPVGSLSRSASFPFREMMLSAIAYLSSYWWLRSRSTIASVSPRLAAHTQRCTWSRGRAEEEVRSAWLGALLSQIFGMGWPLACGFFSGGSLRYHDTRCDALNLALAG